MEQTDVEIARRLLATGYINSREFDVWFRHSQGVTIASLRRDYPNETRGGETWSARQLFRWCERVNKAIEDARLIETDPREDTRNPFRMTLAQGHDTRDTEDKTPQGKTPRSNFPSPERLKAAGGAK